MLSCERCQSMLPEYIAKGEPRAANGDMLRDHLRRCETCTRLAEDLRSVEHALQTWPLHSPPSHLCARIMSNISESPHQTTWAPLPWNIWLPLVSVMTGLFLTLILIPRGQAIPPAELSLEQSILTMSWKQLVTDPNLLWAMWTGLFLALAGVGTTMALALGRMPRSDEVDQLRHRANQAALRILKLTGHS